MEFLTTLTYWATNLQKDSEDASKLFFCSHELKPAVAGLCRHMIQEALSPKDKNKSNKRASKILI
jgi:hypothetical protein